jgi:hypothetical protein
MCLYGGAMIQTKNARLVMGLLLALAASTQCVRMKKWGFLFDFDYSGAWEMTPDGVTVDSYGNTPLHYACWRGDYTGARVLIDDYEKRFFGAHCLLKMTNKRGYTPIEVAYACRYSDIVTLLESHGAVLQQHSMPELPVVGVPNVRDKITKKSKKKRDKKVLLNQFAKLCQQLPVIQQQCTERLELVQLMMLFEGLRVTK